MDLGCDVIRNTEKSEGIRRYLVVDGITGRRKPWDARILIIIETDDLQRHI